MVGKGSFYLGLASAVWAPASGLDMFSVEASRTRLCGICVSLGFLPIQEASHEVNHVILCRVLVR